MFLHFFFDYEAFVKRCQTIVNAPLSLGISNMRGPSQPFHIFGKLVTNWAPVGSINVECGFAKSYCDNITISLARVSDLCKEISIDEWAEELAEVLEKYIELLEGL
jgi:hypothetical protein